MKSALIAELAADDAADTVYQNTKNTGAPVVLTAEDRQKIAAIITAALEETL